RVIGKRRFAGQRVLAFAGIGQPGKFFDTLESVGAQVVVRREFPDHYPYHDEVIGALERAAAWDGLERVATSEDAARVVNGTPAAQRFVEKLSVLEIEVVFQPKQIADKIVAGTIASFRKRVFG